MSKIYEALRRAEQERDRAALKQPAKPDLGARAASSGPSTPPSAARALPETASESNPYFLPEPRRGRLPILLGPGTESSSSRAKAGTNGSSSGVHKASGNGIGNGAGNGATNGGSNGQVKVDPSRVEQVRVETARVETARVEPTVDSFAYKTVSTQIEDTFVVPFDLTQVPTRIWKPALNQLPALLERGAAVEQFRSLRSRMHEFRDLNNLKSILVSSGLPQEGKSFVAANLAVSFARHKASRVLLIDGDMRRPSLHKMLGAPAGPGLTEYLSGKNTLVEVAQRGRFEDSEALLPHGLASLTFISGGDDGDKAADLSGNHKFDKLIATVSGFFDWIVVDTSPVNLVADGVNLARACDGVLLIARGGRTRFETAQRALGELKASKILGFVLNAVQDPPPAGGYYGYDSYDSGQT